MIYIFVGRIPSHLTFFEGKNVHGMFEDMGRFSSWEVVQVHYETIMCTSVVVSYRYAPSRVVKVT